MIRRFGSSRFSNNTDAVEAVNPMDGVANLADVMLVFACGVMLALIINWNVDVGGTVDSVSLKQGMEVSELGELTGSEQPKLDKPDKYEELGVVYRDPGTGKLYMVAKGE